MATTTQTNNTTLNADLLKELQFLMSEGRAAYEQPYTAYDYARIAGLTPDQMAGMAGVRANQGAADPYYAQAAQIANGLSGLANGANLPKMLGNVPQISAPQIAAMTIGARQFPGANLEAYMNPYESLVTGAAIRSAEEAAARAGANADAKYAAAGAFGGSRQGVYDATRENDLIRTISELTNASRAQNYTDAQGMWTKDADRLFHADSTNAQLGLNAAGQNAGNYLKAATSQADNYLRAGQIDINGMLQGGQLGLGAAQLLGTLGTQASQAGYRDAQALMDIGALQRGVDQSNLDLAYKDFQEERDYPWTQLSKYGSLLNGSPLSRSTSTTGTTETPDPSLWSQLLGGGLGLTGLLQNTGAFGSNGYLSGLFGSGGNLMDSSGSDVLGESGWADDLLGGSFFDNAMDYDFWGYGV